MKNVLIFAGRTHHYLKLEPIYNEMKDRGWNARFVIANNAVNIDPAYEFISESDYVHMYDYFNDDSMADMKALRTELMSDFNQRGWTDNVSPFWGVFSLNEFIEVYISFSNLIKNERPDVVIGLHENNFWVKTISALCAKNGIPHFVFQEGLLRDVDQETFKKQSSACEYSSKIFVWGEYEKEKYIQAGVPENKIVVSGPAHLDKWHRVKANREEHARLLNYFREYYGLDSGLTIMFSPPLLHQYKGDVVMDLAYIASHVKNAQMNVIVKLHPFEGEQTANALKQKLSGYSNVKFYTETDPLPLIVASNIMVTQHSTIGIEALALGVPLIEFNLTDEKIIQSWSDLGLATRISSPRTLDKIYMVASGQAVFDINKIEHRIRCAGDSVERCLNEI